jgi:shikimate kinase
MNIKKLFVFICGFTGAGKTTCLRHLQKKAFQHQETQKQRFKDSDDLIVQRLGLRPNQLGDWIREAGMQEFRQLEATVIKDWISEDGYQLSVLSLGGGSFELLSWRELQAIHQQLYGQSSRAFLYWLNTQFKICYERIAKDENRPISSLGFDELSHLYHQRAKQYQMAEFQAQDCEELVRHFQLRLHSSFANRVNSGDT